MRASRPFLSLRRALRSGPSVTMRWASATPAAPPAGAAPSSPGGTDIPRKDFSADDRSATAFFRETLEPRLATAVRPGMQIQWLHAVLDKCADPEELELALDVCRIWAGKGWAFDEAAAEKFAEACCRCRQEEGPVLALNVFCRRTDRLGAVASNAVVASVIQALPRTADACTGPLASLDPNPEASVAQMVLKCLRSMDWRDPPAGPADAETLRVAAELARDHDAPEVAERIRNDFWTFMDDGGKRALRQVVDAPEGDDWQNPQTSTADAASAPSEAAAGVEEVGEYAGAGEAQGEAAPANATPAAKEEDEAAAPAAPAAPAPAGQESAGSTTEGAGSSEGAAISKPEDGKGS